MSNASELSALSVDGTFNFGKFELTPFTYSHPNIECKSKNIPNKRVPATIICLTLIQAYKTQETYVTGFQTVARKCTFKNDELSLITGGEQVLIDSCKITFIKCNLYRCTNHFKSNCEEVLDINYQTKQN